MKVIRAVSVDEALHDGIHYLKSDGIKHPSRNGDTLEAPEPVATVFEEPWNYVLQERLRKENPFLHFFEALWVLSGRNDLDLPTFFAPRFAEYSDNGVTLNAAYGFRMRRTWEDQLEGVVQAIREDKYTRQAVIQLWDPYDLTHPTKDKACNMSVVFRIRKNQWLNDRLDMIVYNRSNDIIWGLYGSNVVTFSMMQDYVAGQLGVNLGAYTHISNSYHAYLDGPGGKIFSRLSDHMQPPERPTFIPGNMVLWGGATGKADAYKKRLTFNQDLDRFRNLPIDQPMMFTHRWWTEVVSPLHHAWLMIKQKKYNEADQMILLCRDIRWREVCLRWLNRNRK